MRGVEAVRQAGRDGALLVLLDLDSPRLPWIDALAALGRGPSIGPTDRRLLRSRERRDRQGRDRGGLYARPASRRVRPAPAGPDGRATSPRNDSATGATLGAFLSRVHALHQEVTPNPLISDIFPSMILRTHDGRPSDPSVLRSVQYEFASIRSHERSTKGRRTRRRRGAGTRQRAPGARVRAVRRRSGDRPTAGVGPTGVARAQAVRDAVLPRPPSGARGSEDRAHGAALVRDVRDGRRPRAVCRGHPARAARSGEERRSTC